MSAALIAEFNRAFIAAMHARAQDSAEVTVRLSGIRDAKRMLDEGAHGGKDTVVVISADANAKHQSVVTVMEAARHAGLNQITFATQSSQASGQ